MSANAYGLYLVHYVFIVWLQYALLAAPLFAIIKAGLVFGGTLVLSLATIAAARRIPWGGRLIGAPPRAVVADALTSRAMRDVPARTSYNSLLMRR